MHIKLITAATAAIFALSAMPATAGAVERACLKSSRPAANAPLCACIDAAARSTLSFAEQNRAGMLIRRPDLAERIQRSKRKNDRTFWAQYKLFAKTAGARCS
jgi:hypothetical protein